MIDSLKNIIHGFDPVSLEELGGASLMNRVDTKYLTKVENLLPLLQQAQPDYYILEIENERLKSYYTKYFDTHDLEMYNHHRSGKRARQKIRIRRYEGAEPIEFLEVKDKNNKGRTKKTRKQLEPDSVLGDYEDFIASKSNYSLLDLRPVIENRFFRITLVKKDMSERITIDTGIEFHNILTGAEKNVSHLSVIEWKRERLSGNSPMRWILKNLGIRKSGFSKYCVGMAMTDSSLRQNRVKPRIRHIEKLSFCES